jgi:hypothetical protein
VWDHGRGPPERQAVESGPLEPSLLGDEPIRSEHFEKALEIYDSIGDAGADEIRKRHP